MQEAGRYTPRPQVEPVELDAESLEKMAKELKNNQGYIEVAANQQLRQIPKPTGVWAWIAKIWKPENQRFLTIATCVHDRLVIALSQAESQPDQRHRIQKSAQHLFKAYQSFLASSGKAIPATLIISDVADMMPKVHACRAGEVMREQARSGKGDCILQCADGQCSVHSSVLINREDTSFFDSPFQEGWKKESVGEKPLLRVLEDYPESTVQLLMDFLYLHELPSNFNPKELINLYQLADHINLSELKTLCLGELQRKVISEPALIFEWTKEYWSLQQRNPAVEDLFFILLADVCKEIGTAHQAERTEIIKLLEAVPAKDYRYPIIMSLVEQAHNPLGALLSRCDNNKVLAKEILEKAGKDHFPLSYGMLMSFYEAEGNKDEARKYAQRPTTSLWGISTLGIYYHNNEEYEKAYAVFTDAAERGSIYAKAVLANMLAYGQGVSQDTQRAIMILRNMEDNGIALSYLGYAYCFGIGVEKDRGKAKEFFQKAMEFGSPIAPFGLGAIFYKERNDDEAYRLFRLGAEQGNESAQQMLGDCYEHGRGIAVDLQQAKEWYRKAAAVGHERARKALQRLS